MREKDWSFDALAFSNRLAHFASEKSLSAASTCLSICSTTLENPYHVFMAAICSAVCDMAGDNIVTSTANALEVEVSRRLHEKKEWRQSALLFHRLRNERVLGGHWPGYGNLAAKWIHGENKQESLVKFARSYYSHIVTSATKEISEDCEWERSRSINHRVDPKSNEPVKVDCGEDEGSATNEIETTPKPSKAVHVWYILIITGMSLCYVERANYIGVLKNQVRDERQSHLNFRSDVKRECLKAMNAPKGDEKLIEAIAFLLWVAQATGIQQDPYYGWYK